MITLLKLSFISVLVCGFVLLLLGMFRRKYDLVSWRNLFLAGMGFFYSVGGLVTIDHLSVTDQSMGILAALIPPFIGLFLISNVIGGKLSIVDKIPQIGLQPTATAIYAVVGAGVLLAIASAGVSAVGYLSALATQFKDGFAVAAVGIASYYAIVRRFNPVALGLLAGAVLVALVVAMVGTSGRRALLAVFLAVGWIWWYAWARYRPISKTVVRAVIIGGAALVFLVGYTSVRHEYSRSSSISERAEQFKDIATNFNLRQSAFIEMLGQDAPDQTLFIIDSYGEQFEHIPLHGLVYFFVNPIPRGLWPDKPVGLGLTLQEQREANANLGPGIIGHGWAEAGAVGVAYYAIFFGLVTGVVDRLLRNRASDPFFVIIFGVSLGNVFGLPRGETSLFFVRLTTAGVSAAGLLIALRFFAGPVLNATGLPLYPKFPDQPDDNQPTADPYEADMYEEDAYQDDAYADEQPYDAYADPDGDPDGYEHGDPPRAPAEG